LDTPRKLSFFAYWPGVQGLLRSLKLRRTKRKQNMSEQEQKLPEMFVYLV
jgi:hypothetical protein